MTWKSAPRRDRSKCQSLQLSSSSVEVFPILLRSSWIVTQTKLGNLYSSLDRTQGLCSQEQILYSEDYNFENIPIHQKSIWMETKQEFADQYHPCIIPATKQPFVQPFA